MLGLDPNSYRNHGTERSVHILSDDMQCVTFSTVDRALVGLSPTHKRWLHKQFPAFAAALHFEEVAACLESIFRLWLGSFPYRYYHEREDVAEKEFIAACIKRVRFSFLIAINIA